MRRVRVILYGVGAVGKEVSKCLLSKPGIDIVGALGNVFGVGKDLGEVAGIGRNLNIIVTNDAAALFSEAHADVVIHSSCTTVAESYEQMRRPLEAGMNIITAAEEMNNPYIYNPGLAAKLDRLATKNGVSILASGLWPTCMDLYLPLALSGVCRNVRRVKYFRRSDLRPYRDSIVARHFGLGVTREKFDKGLADGTIVGHVGFEGSYEILAHHFGWKLEEVKKSCEAVYDNGISIAVKTSAKGFVNGETKLEMELFGSLKPDIQTSDTIQIDADPPINMVISPQVSGLSSVGNALVNAIPHVMRAKPGIVARPEIGLFCFGGEIGSYI